MKAPSPFSALPPALITEASPKAISGRTSYLRVRLAFHPYPQLIRRLFNDGRFEPPLNFTSASLWPWVDHPVSGLHQRTSRPIKTRFRFGSGFSALTSLVNVTRRSVLQKVRRRAFNALRLLVDTWFQVLFHSPPGVLFTFPSRYLFAIGRFRYLALAGGPAGFPRGSTCPAVLGIPLRNWLSFAYRSFTFCAPAFQPCSARHPTSVVEVPQPRQCKHRRFRLYPFRSPLLGVSRFLSFPPGT